jgi:hypothetical protein
LETHSSYEETRHPSSYWTSLEIFNTASTLVQNYKCQETVHNALQKPSHMLNVSWVQNPGWNHTNLTINEAFSLLFLFDWLVEDSKTMVT